MTQLKHHVHVAKTMRKSKEHNNIKISSVCVFVEKSVNKPDCECLSNQANKILVELRDARSLPVVVRQSRTWNPTRHYRPGDSDRPIITDWRVVSHKPWAQSIVSAYGVCEHLLTILVMWSLTDSLFEKVTLSILVVDVRLMSDIGGGWLAKHFFFPSVITISTVLERFSAKLFSFFDLSPSYRSVASAIGDNTLFNARRQIWVCPQSRQHPSEVNPCHKRPPRWMWSRYLSKILIFVLMLTDAETEISTSLMPIVP